MARLLITAGLFFAEGVAVFATGGALAPVFANPGSIAATAAAGMALGSILFQPPQPPRLLDRQVMSSANGAPILFGYGTQRVSGEVVWSSGLLILRKGDSDFTSFKDSINNSIPTRNAYVTNLAVAFGQGPADITRLWFDSKLVYDTRGTVYRGPWQAGITYNVDDVVLDWSMSSNPVPNTDSQPLIYFICVQAITATENTNYPHETAVFWEQIAANYDRATGQILYRYGFVNDPAYQGQYDIALTDSGLNLLDVDPFDYINPKIYRGDETQLPDALLESQIGVGKTSAMRGLCYLVLENFVVWDFGNRIPNIRAEVTWSAEFSYPVTTTAATNGSKIEIDPNDQIVHVLDATSSNMQRLDLTTSVMGSPQALPASVLNDAFCADAQGNVWISHDTGSGFSNLYKLDGANNYAVLLTIAMPSGVFPEQIGFCTSGGVGYIACGSRLSGGTGQFHFEVYRADGYHVGGVSFGNPGSITYGEWFAYPCNDGTNIWMITPHTSDGNFDIWKITLPGLVATSNTVTPGVEGESLCCAWYGGENTLIMPTANGLIAKWDIASSTYSMLVTGTINTAHLMWDNSDFAAAYSAVHAQGGNRLWTGFFRIPYDASNHIIAAWSVSSADPVGAINQLGIDQTFYTGVKLYDLDNWFGTGWAGLQYSIDGNQMWLYDGGTNSLVIVQAASVSVLQLDRVTSGPGQLSNIVTDTCRRVGIDAEKIDVSELTGMSLVGYTVARPSQAKQILQPIAGGFFFDVVESDKKLKFLPRPQAVAMSIPAEDLGLDKDKGAITEEIGQEADFPQQIDVSYQDPALNYQIGHQYHWRNTRVVGARDRHNLDLPYAIPAYQARQTAIKLMKQFWKGKLQHSFNLFRASYLQLDPADVVSFTDPFTQLSFTARILQMASGQDRTMRLSLVAEDPSSYVTSGASGAGPGTSTSGASDTGGTGSGSTGSNGGGSGGSGSGVVSSGGGTITTSAGVPYDIAFLLPGPIAGSYDWRFTVDGNLPTLPINLSGSSLTAEVAATADVSLPLNQIPGGTGAPVQIGSLNFTAGQKVGSFSFNNAVTLAQGDVLQIDPSAVTDATLAGVSGVFAATR